MANKVTSLLFAILMFSIVIIGFTMFSTDLLPRYNVEATSVAALNATREVENLTVDMTKRLREGFKIDEPSTWLNFIWIGLSALNMVFAVPDILASMAADIVGIPAFASAGWVIAIILIAASILVIFNIITAITKTEV